MSIRPTATHQSPDPLRRSAHVACRIVTKGQPTDASVHRTEPTSDAHSEHLRHGPQPYDLIYRSIVEGRYAPGQRLVEQRIADELGISRTPVREAIRQLEASGLVVTERNRGAIVRPLTRQDIMDSYELRGHLESLAAERAASRATPEDLEAMDAAINDLARALQAKDIHDIEILRLISQANKSFHDAVLRAAHHERLFDLLRVTVDATLVFRAFQHFDKVKARRSNDFHQQIRDAIAKHDPRRANRLMAEHIDQGRDALLASFPSGSDPLGEEGDI